MPRLLGVGALALALLFIAPEANAAGFPLVTGKCGCAIGGGLFTAKCARKGGVCTRAECEAACQAAMPAKTSAVDPWDADRPQRSGHEFRAMWSHSADTYEGMTDVSAARRLHRVWGVHRSSDLRGGGWRGYTSRSRGGYRSPARMGVARAAQGDRNGRGHASALAGLPASGGEVTHRRGRGLAREAIRGAAIGGQVAVEHSRPSDCYGIAWCGCWLRHTFGLADRSLNLAINWARIGSAASPDSANVVVWRHHVGKLISHDGNGRILVQSGNDRGAVRTRWLSPHVLGGVVAYRKV